MKNTFQNFLNIYLKNGFQSLSKKDIDLLVFYFMEQNKLIDGNTNYDKARNLKITPNRLATLQLESYMRWGDENRESVLKELFSRLFQKESLERIISEQSEQLKKSKISLHVENPVEKIQLERTLKEKYSNIEYTFNKEVVIISIKTLLELIFISDIDKTQLQKTFLKFQDIDIKKVLAEKDFTAITFEEYRKLLNEIAFGSVKEVGKSILGKLGGVI